MLFHAEAAFEAGARGLWFGGLAARNWGLNPSLELGPESDLTTAQVPDWCLEGLRSMTGAIWVEPWCPTQSRKKQRKYSRVQGYGFGEKTPQPTACITRKTNLGANLSLSGKDYKDSSPVSRFDPNPGRDNFTGLGYFPGRGHCPVSWLRSPLRCPTYAER